MFTTLRNDITINTDSIEQIIKLNTGQYTIHFVSGTKLTIDADQYDYLMWRINNG